MARLMFSCGMLASLADSMAALRRMLILASPPPLRAATVISRRIFENSLPRWTSVLPFFRLICDHRECPDMALLSFVGDRGFQSLHPLEPPLASRQGGLPPPLLARRLGDERRRRSRPEVPTVRPQMYIGEEGRARVADLAAPRHLGQHLDAHLDRGRADVVEPGLERHHLVGEDRRI